MLRAAGRLVPAGGRAGPAGSCSLRGCAPFGGVAGLCQPVGVWACGEGKAAGPRLSSGRAAAEPPGSEEGPRPVAWLLGPGGVR